MSDDFDPVLSEIVRNYELTMNREMGRALVNLSGSFLFVSASDYACGCLDPEGNILTTIAWSLQMGFAMSNTVRASLERFGDDLHPGDMIFANDPYDGGGLHSHDVVVVAPVFAGEELVMWVGVSAHVTDVGGAVAGGYAIEPMECYGENLRFTPVKFYDQGKFRGDIIDAFLTNTRVPKQTGIDIKALLGAVWIGRERVGALLEQHGAERIRAIHASQIEASGRAFRSRLASLPDGAYSGAAHMEHDGASDRVYTIRATVIKRGEPADGRLHRHRSAGAGRPELHRRRRRRQRDRGDRDGARAGHPVQPGVARAGRHRVAGGHARERGQAGADLRRDRLRRVVRDGCDLRGAELHDRGVRGRAAGGGPGRGARGRTRGCRAPTSTASRGSGTCSPAARAARARSRAATARTR